MGTPRVFSLIRRNVVVASIVALSACTDSTAPAAASLSFSLSPGGSKVAGNPIGTVTVTVLDERGRVVTSADNRVTLDLDQSGAGLIGTVAVNAVNGVATFDDLRINKAAPQYRLVASSPGLASASSTGFSIVSGSDAGLAFTVQPVTGIANVQLPPLAVDVQDALGNKSTQNGRGITLSLGSNPTGAFLNGIVVRGTVNGTVTFSGLSITKPGKYTLVASAAGLSPVTSASFDMIVGPPTQLAFTRSPAVAGIGEVFDPPPTVGLFDQGNNPVVSPSFVVNLTLAPGQSGGSLSGTTSVTSAGGVAVFPGLSISAPGADYRIVATSPSVTGSVTSNVISVRNPIVMNSISSGYFHSCGRGVDGKIYCWGDNGSGQLGLTGEGRRVPSGITSSLDFVSVSAGRTHSCGVVADGTAYCWGDNSDGQSSGSPTGPTPRRVSDVLKFASVSAGYSHSCGLDASGKAYCWGDNSLGQVGGVGVAGTAVAVSGGIAFSSITAGRYFTCGVALDGTAYCWGQNETGELGDSTSTKRAVPTRVAGGLKFRFVQAGGFHACGLTTDGKAYCWGQNAYGQLGNDRTTDSKAPVAVAGGLTFASLSVGNRHACGVTEAGQGYCWGDNSSGALGAATGSASLNVPILVSGGINFLSISAGRFHSCGVSANVAYCWGASGSLLGTGRDNGTGLPEVVR